MKNKTMLQYFEWYLPEDSAHWDRAREDAPGLAALGITDVWLPPAYKGHLGTQDAGYGVYDLYDLGEFYQKDTVATKYGTKEAYIGAIRALQRCGIRVYADIVLNHRLGADYCEILEVDECAGWNRTLVVKEDQKIHAWTGYDFPGRCGKYSRFCWNHTHFDGVDWDERTRKNAIYRINSQSWDEPVDLDNGSFDYLMGADVNFDHPEVLAELDNWGRWYLLTTGVDGFRLDAVKHIPFDFFSGWLARLRSFSGAELPAVGEYWNGDSARLQEYLKQCGGCMDLFDVALHFRFFQAAQEGAAFDLRTIFDGTLVQADPEHAVTFVDNHDSQPGQSLESWVQDWFRPLAYALILLRREGVPCVFYGDLKGIPHDGIAPMGAQLERMLRARQTFATGAQTDYLDFPSVIGWTREGGAAVVLSNGAFGWKHMKAGIPGQVYVDLLENRTEEITIDARGWADFTCNAGSVSVWVPKE